MIVMLLVYVVTCRNPSLGEKWNVKNVNVRIILKTEFYLMVLLC